MTSDALEPAPLWWVKFWCAISHVICEALWIFNVPLPGKYLREEYGDIANVWCCHIHSTLETYSWALEGYPTKRAIIRIQAPRKEI